MNVISRMLRSIEVVGVGVVALVGYGSEIDDANRLFVLEQYDDAIRIYENASSTEAGSPAEEALFGMGRAYQMLGRWKPAKESFERLLRAHPTSDLVPGARVQVGQCEVKLGNPQGALLIFENIEKAYPGEETAVEAAYNISNLKAGFFGRDVKNAREAIQGYQQVLESPRSDRYAVQSHFGLGQCYMLLRDYPQAIAEFQSVLEKGPDTIWASYAGDQLVRAMRAYGNRRSLEMVRNHQAVWAELERRFRSPLLGTRGSIPRLPATRPMMRIRAVGFFTESQKDGTGTESVVYLAPTIRYKNYVFTCERGTVDRTRNIVNCVGNVECTDGLAPPSLMVTSSSLTLDTGNGKAIFSEDVQLEKRFGDDPVQRVVVGELHLLLDSGAIEIPPKQ